MSSESRPEHTLENLAGVHRWSRDAAAQGAELVVFPELSLTGFVPNHPVGDHAEWLQKALRSAWSTAEPIDGPTVTELSRISAETGVWLAAGLMENAGNVLFNTFVLVGEGRLQGRWRKMHIPMFEMPIYNGGDAPDVVDTPFGRIGANICFDTLLPESTRLLGVDACEIALFPFAADPAPGTAAAWAEWARPVIQARCVENALFGLACNYAGHVECAGAQQTFPGGTLVVGPDGRVQAESAGPMLVTKLDTAALFEARSAFEYTFRFRRPELYGRLTRR